MAQAVMIAEPQAQAQVVQALVSDSMDMVAESLASVKINEDVHKKNRIQVSNTKKPLFFYLNLAKRYIKQHNDVELSALGMAIPTVVTIAEILKSNGFAVEKKVLTSTVGSKDENKGRFVQKAKLEIVLEKNDKSPTSTDATEKSVPKTETKGEPDESKDSEIKTEATTAQKKEG
ncbi:hypothetical protein BVRB_3g056620 [Beta vulgaris subsp. vulgaris]|uniref:uncharacterized protein At2g34160 n=1 Tax=Beta vulgaris subsp. vulgaris TaxID=3555 RepID=UPI00053F73A0|nr:uncharacterized protein At2g34160 [Beta vulgaris subsp. vulgaris]KMT15675.1 hypothetical protein BVRB_3g056620 [Beta vulgaris subsp. vulgaris]